jgi:hypothetical protein
VRTTSGLVHGQLTDTTRVFSGIPYAAPPVNDHPFTAPSTASPWPNTREATSPGPDCPQPNDPGKQTELPLPQHHYATELVGRPLTRISTLGCPFKDVFIQSHVDADESSEERVLIDVVREYEQYGDSPWAIQCCEASHQLTPGQFSCRERA